MQGQLRAKGVDSRAHFYIADRGNDTDEYRLA
jgi:hypothetical protein